ncbi:hypothetical protein MLD38_026022 [Melastoma candidum]|uniref:Uncharacterized protein n=1 Tax=Melastoma candidum TaxID=119954 RepID=A0ACB9P046_9MYRT|nr:hypothetical protein MLD38_026022 [Melastoma candidum]
MPSLSSDVNKGGARRWSRSDDSSVIGHSNSNCSYNNYGCYCYDCGDLSTKEFWSSRRDVVCYNQLHKFWSVLSPQARQELLKIDRQTLLGRARKNMYCSRCNGLLLEEFLQIVTDDESFEQGEGAEYRISGEGVAYPKAQWDGALTISNSRQDEIQDPSMHPWGGLTVTCDGSLTLLESYSSSKSFDTLRAVFDSARARERQRVLLYPDACGGEGGRGWISQGTTTNGRGHGTREACAIHTARLSRDTLLDFWTALGEEARQTLLRMKEEDFIERLIHRFDSKRFCRDCRKNVIREFKELKELKRMRKEPRCNCCFCVADTGFQYEVSDDTVHADWHDTFVDSLGAYQHFEWAIGTGEGKADILEFENVGLATSVKATGLELGGLDACFITLRAWRYDGHCTEISVKALNLNGQECVHSRLIVGNGFVTITIGEGITRFFEVAEEAEEEEDDDSMDKDKDELDGECSRPRKHAKSPELAREFLLDAAMTIFEEQIEKAFREGIARQNAHSIFVCLALTLLEESVHIACKDIITLEKQMKLLEEEEKEKHEEEKRKERKKAKEREKKLRRKERYREKERERTGALLEDEHTGGNVLKEEASPCAGDVRDEKKEIWVSNVDSKLAEIEEEVPSSSIESPVNDSSGVDLHNMKDEAKFCTTDNSKISFRILRQSKEGPNVNDQRSNRCRPTASEGCSLGNRSGSHNHRADNVEIQPRAIHTPNRNSRMNSPKSESRISGHKYSDKFQLYRNTIGDGYNGNPCGCNDINGQQVMVSPHVSGIRLGPEAKYFTKSESLLDSSNHFHCSNKYNQVDEAPYSNGRLKSRKNQRNISRDSLQTRKIWEPMQSQEKYPESNSNSSHGTLVSSNFSGQVKDSDNDKPSTGDSVGLPPAQKDDQSEGSADSEDCLSEDNTDAKDKEVRSHTCSTTMKSSSSNSDHYSSCLSEVDSNASSDNGSSDSSPISDSEEASPKAERKEARRSNSISEEAEVQSGAKEVSDGNEAFKGQQAVFGLSLDGIEINSANQPPVRTPKHPGIVPMQGQNVYFPLFQDPAAMGFYSQNLASWQPVQANGMMTPFPCHANYLYPGLPQYMDRSPGYCMQYGGIQRPSDPYRVISVPAFHPAALPSGVSPTGETRISTAVTESNEVQKERFFIPAERRSIKPPPTESPFADSSFSLFHFGGPVGLSTLSNSQTEEGTIRALPPVDPVIPDCKGKNAPAIEEYNLFAKSNGINFSLY